MDNETETRRAQLVRYGVPVVAAVVAVLLGIQLVQDGLGAGRGALFFFVGACVILVGSIAWSVWDARVARAQRAVDAVGADHDPLEWREGDEAAPRAGVDGRSEEIGGSNT